MSAICPDSRPPTPKSILKPARCPSKTCLRSVSFCVDPSVRTADAYDRSPACVTTELSWSDIEELRRLNADLEMEDAVDTLDEARASMDLPALLAAAPASLLPLLPPLTTITRPVPTLTLPAPRNKGFPQKRPAPAPAPSRGKRPLLAFLPLLPVGEGQPSASPFASLATPNSSPYFVPGNTGSTDVDMSPCTDSSSSPDTASPVTPPGGVRLAQVGMDKEAFEVAFKRRVPTGW